MFDYDELKKVPVGDLEDTCKKECEMYKGLVTTMPLDNNAFMVALGKDIERIIRAVKEANELAIGKLKELDDTFVSTAAQYVSEEQKLVLRHWYDSALYMTMGQDFLAHVGAQLAHMTSEGVMALSTLPMSRDLVLGIAAQAQKKHDNRSAVAFDLRQHMYVVDTQWAMKSYYEVEAVRYGAMFYAEKVLNLPRMQPDEGNDTNRNTTTH